jgi:(1->4)-alpha-D-glucan 1-alpha-D-glucosylmutase
LRYYENSYPASIRSYSAVLSEAGKTDLLNKFSEGEGEEANWEGAKINFLLEVENDQDVKEKIFSAVDRINNSDSKFQEILNLQYFLPTHWKQTEKEINYRRFFTINGLICLSMEQPEVFENYHLFIKELCDSGFIQGLRIDHVDGLFDPEKYLEQLREMLGQNFYIIVEKILEADEKLPGHWPVQGTSGYDFLAQVNHLFTKSSNEFIFNDAYEKISPKVPDYEKLIYRKKLFILKERMGGELQNLCNILKEDQLLDENLNDEKALEASLSAFLAAFPVYRIYPKEFPLKPRQTVIIETAFRKALDELPDREMELDYLKKLFMGEADKDNSKMLYFLQRCQQFSGPLAAKGVEDTSFYIYNRLVSHNEVGDSPDHFGITIDDFHQKMQKGLKNFPLSINATATHDTKRGEDARMRLNVLSEIPEEWFALVNQWKEINAGLRKDEHIPGKNEEYFIYQTLIAGMPFKEEEDFFSRTCDYLQKVLREAKVHSNWANPDEDYENAVFEFVKDILEHEEFRNSLDPFIKKVSGFGVIKSLGQSLIKMTAPGIPDIYQGTELWDLSYVDPDNRRPVDYGLRTNYIADFRFFSKTNLKKKINTLKTNYATGKIKMYTLYKTLLQRRRDQNLYKKGEYIPLNVTGKSGGEIIAYARVLDDQWRIIIVPVLVTGLFDHENLAPYKERLKDAFVELPDNAPGEWDNVFTGGSMVTHGKLPLEDFLSDFPVALLKNKI